MTASILICAHEPGRRALIATNTRKLASRIGAEKPEEFSDAATAMQRLAADEPRAIDLAIIDARLPRTEVDEPDITGSEALHLAEWVRDNFKKPPVIIVTEQTPAPEEIDGYCKPENMAIALPLKQLQSNFSLFSVFFDMLQEKPTWNTIEVTVQGKSAACHLLSPDSSQMKWGVVISDSLKRAAKKYERQEKPPENWLEDMRNDGLQLFDTLIKGSLGAGFFAHIERAAGQLEGMAFRFKVADAELHATPFEALGRPDESDMENSPFVLLHAPIARQVTNVLVRPTAGARAIPRPARMLFVRSQVASNPEGIVLHDIARLPVKDPRTGKPQVSFAALRNIDLELGYLEKLRGELPEDELEITLLDLTAPENAADAVAALRTELQKQEYDILHFAGHSKTIGFGPSGNTYLILPGAKVGEAVAVSVERFAEYAGQRKVRLVYLSSCQGSSARSVASLVQHGVSHVVGFRWDIDDDRAAEFAKAFYSCLFTGPRTVCAAFRSACNMARQSCEKEGESAIWASPILIAQTDDWLVSPFTPAPACSTPATVTNESAVHEEAVQ
jgi:hypothetical protein